MNLDLMLHNFLVVYINLWKSTTQTQRMKVPIELIVGIGNPLPYTCTFYDSFSFQTSFTRLHFSHVPDDFL